MTIIKTTHFLKCSASWGDNMIEITVLNYLISKNLTGINNNVYLEVPESPPAEYILVEKTGSGEMDRINQAMIAVQSISRTSLVTALGINELVKTAMKEFPEESTEIYACKLNSDYNFTNTETKEYRYQAVFNLYF